MKRYLFPSTLWEAGRRPLASVAELLRRVRPLDGAIVVLHTTYLAPAAAELRSLGATVLVDAYDLVWRSHANDSEIAGPGVRRLRRLYAAAVRPRELSALRAADGLVVAGYADLESLAPEFPRASWVPTAPAVERDVGPPPAGDALRVGLLGHFRHRQTLLSARALLDSPLAADTDVEIVIGGLGSSEAIRPRPRVTVLGPLSEAADFYARIDAVVAPVLGGSGIKVKLAEAVLAGRPAVTTPLGAEGFAPALRDHFLLRATDELTVDLVRAHVESWNAAGRRAEFERTVGGNAVVRSYARAVASLGAA